jgi:hypothetical protein
MFQAESLPPLCSHLKSYMNINWGGCRGGRVRWEHEERLATLAGFVSPVPMQAGGWIRLGAHNCPYFRAE